MPNGVGIANQAIRADLIVAKLAPEDMPPPTTVDRPRLWSVSPDPEFPHGVFGRERLLKWIDSAIAENPGLRSERVYAAISHAPKSGKTFTSSVLKAARRRSDEPIVILGERERELLPRTLPDFVRALGDQLGVAKGTLDAMPPRPGPDLPAKSADADKLKKWASEEVPRWFDKVLAEHRATEIDAREEARRQVDVLRRAGVRVPEDMQQRAVSAEAILDTRNRWTVAWVILDGLAETTLSADIWDCIGGLIGNVSEQSVPQELRRLRWLFLGQVPDFLASDATLEPLDPSKIGPKEFVEAYGAICASRGESFSTQDANHMLKFAKVMLRRDYVELRDPALRLKELQNIFSELQQLGVNA